MRFRATLELHGKTATGITVPPEVVESLDGGKRPPVTVTLNDVAYRTTIAPMGGVFLIGVSADIRAQAGVRAGDEVDVDVVLNTAPRSVAVPDDLAAAIDAEPGLRAAWDKLANSHRREHVRAVEEAKKPETRVRRINKAVEMLRPKV